ncbi:hypothetical protein BKA64DRAFT_641065 [Cadophora sp. MPI-SDFR-AT-0126]|nr:hypothetical protein BKA64DRAFT_641065 [Leotiomycetes sp. MPI-SDFR-AT-0126]
MAEELRWLSQATNYAPAFDNAKEIISALKDFETSTLAEETYICWLSKQSSLGASLESSLSDNDFTIALDQIDGGHNILLINRFLVLSKRAPMPIDSSKPRISASVFRILISRLHLSATFVYALSRYHLPCGRGFSTGKDFHGETFHEMWYFLPLRIQYRCNDKAKEHQGSTAGSNQMNPFHYLLHLSDVGIDIRGSRIALFSRYNATGKTMVTLAVSFMDGRWSKTALEPKTRIKELWDRSEDPERLNDPFQIHYIYFTSALRWWTNTLDGINEQLMAYTLVFSDHIRRQERRLHEAIDTESQVNTLGILNKALHAVAAHLQRYNNELESIQETWQDIIKHRNQYQSSCARASNPDHSVDYGIHDLNQMSSHLKQLRAFLEELMAKVQNNLALLFNCIQLTNDRRMVANGENMHAILLASRDEARSSKEIAEQSIKLSEEMKQDSVAMKTVSYILSTTEFQY